MERQEYCRPFRGTTDIHGNCPLDVRNKIPVLKKPTADQYLITLVLWNQSKRRSTDKKQNALEFPRHADKTNLPP